MQLESSVSSPTGCHPCKEDKHRAANLCLTYLFQSEASTRKVKRMNVTEEFWGTVQELMP